jgi:hypothetical protein
MVGLPELVPCDAALGALFGVVEELHERDGEGVGLSPDGPATTGLADDLDERRKV